MAQSIDLLWFDDINPFNEQVFDFPILGRLSMRQMLLLGIGAIISYALYQSTSDVIYSIIPASIMAFIALKKQKVLSTEQMLMSIILYAMKGSFAYGENGSSIKSRAKILQLLFRTRRKEKEIRQGQDSGRLYLASEFSAQTGRKDKRIDVTARDLMKPVRIKMKLLLSSGEVLASKMAKVYLDDEYIASVSSDINGELEVLVIPKHEGERRFRVYAEGFTEPVLDELLFVSKP